MLEMLIPLYSLTSLLPIVSRRWKIERSSIVCSTDSKTVRRNQLHSNPASVIKANTSILRRGDAKNCHAEYQANDSSCHQAQDECQVPTKG